MCVDLNLSCYKKEALSTALECVGEHVLEGEDLDVGWLVGDGG